LCTSYWEYELSLESAPKYTPLDVMAIVVIVANHPSIGFSSEFEIEMESTYSLGPTYLLGFLKLYLLMFLYNLLHFFLLLQKFSETWMLKKISKKKKNKLEKEKANLFLET